MNIDTLVKSFYSDKDETESLINEVMKFLLVEKAMPTEDRVIRRPTIKITEMWGKTQNGDRDVMEALMRNIAGATVKEKIESVNAFMTAQAPSEGEGDITKIMTYLIFLDTFASIVNDYGASVAGFLFESFLAALFGGGSIQVDDPEQVGAAPGSLPIEDVRLAIKQGEEETAIRPYSLKVLAKNGQVKGSFKNIVDYFLDPSEQRQTDDIVYLIVIKDVDKGDKGWNGKLKFYEFVISRDNFLQKIGAPTIVPVYGYAPYQHTGNRRTINPEKNVFPKSAKPQLRGKTRYKLPDGSDITEPITIEAGDQLLSYQVVGEKGVIKGAASKLYNPEDYERISSKFQDADEIDRQVFQELTQTKGYQGEKQWVITKSEYTKDEFYLGDIDLRPDVLRVKAEEYSRSLNDSIVKIFNAVGDLTDNINKYFIGEKGENRKVAGLEARQDAEILKVEVDKTITVK